MDQDNLNSFINITQGLFLLGMVIVIIRQLVPYIKKNNIWKNIALILDTFLVIAVIVGYLSAVFMWFIEREMEAKRVWMYLFIATSIFFTVALIARIYIWRKKIVPTKKVVVKDNNK